MKKLIVFCIFTLFILQTASANGKVEETPAVSTSTVEFVTDSTNSQPLSFDNLKIGETLQIDGYASITLTEVTAVDTLRSYNPGATHTDTGWSNTSFVESGPEAEFCILKMDVTNLQLEAMDFIDDCTVTAVYDDVYQYAGWIHQHNWDNTGEGSYGGDAGKTIYIAPEDRFEIAPMYTGHYLFGVTLPNAILSDNAPLSIHIKAQNEEFTYIVRN